MSGPGDSGIGVDYIREEIKLLEIQVALQKRERDVGVAEAALRASYASLPSLGWLRSSLKPC